MSSVIQGTPFKDDGRVTAPKVDEKAMMAWLFSYARSVWKQLLVLNLLSLVAIGISLAQPIPLRVLSDSIFNDLPAFGPYQNYDSSNKELLSAIAISLVLVTVIGAAFGIVYQVIATRFGISLDNRIKREVFSKILHIPIKLPGKMQSGDYIHRLSAETSAVNQLVMGSVTKAISSSLTLIITVIVLFMIEPLMAGFSLMIIPILFCSVAIFGKKIEKKAAEAQERQSEVMSFATETLQNMDLVQSFNRQESQTNRMFKILHRAQKSMMDMMLLGMGIGLVNVISVSLMLSALLIINANAVLNGTLSLGELILFNTYMLMMLEPVQSLAQQYTSYRESMASIIRVREILEQPSEPTAAEAVGVRLPVVQGYISFRNVSFSYGERKVLEDINLDIAPKQKIAIVGPSGAGKSALLDLLSRFINPTNGTIYLDGYDIQTLNLEFLRDQISFVDQNPKLFNMSITENIAYSLPENVADDEHIAAALTAANTDEFIEHLPEGIKTSVGASAEKLSGGQAQRIAMARSFLRGTPLLLLDEPMSSQDSQSEKYLLRTITQIMKSRTVVLISHKYSLLQQMDAVYAIENHKLINVKDRYGSIQNYMSYLNTHELI